MNSCLHLQTQHVTCNQWIVAYISNVDHQGSDRQKLISYMEGLQNQLGSAEVKAKHPWHKSMYILSWWNTVFMSGLSSLEVQICGHHVIVRFTLLCGSNTQSSCQSCLSSLEVQICSNHVIVRFTKFSGLNTQSSSHCQVHPVQWVKHTVFMSLSGSPSSVG